MEVYLVSIYYALQVIDIYKLSICFKHVCDLVH